MAINRASISKELLPGLNAVFGMEYGEVADEHKPLFETENSDRAFEEEVLFTGFGTAPTKAEGAAVSFDDAQESFTSRYTHETVALAFAITEEAMEDNLYDTFAKLRAKGLARAMANTKQVKAADVFNNGFNSAFAGGDGQQLFSASHPTIGDGNQSNTLGATDLSEASLESALITISKAKDDRGILIGLQTQSLHIPSDLAFTADQILNSTMSTTIGVNPTTAANGATNVNDINSIRNQGMVPGGFFVNRRFTDTNAWFLKTDCPNGTKMFVRSPLQTKMEPDFDTGNVRFKARERYSFGFSDWRSYYGASGSS
ncbi:MAG: hypothetical protein CMM62_20765 [Rhodospirillaceae bacterium]|jgi:hypothetical protein|nr:hypothetical protein [Rhodospirillaceae bacterium]